MVFQIVTMADEVTVSSLPHPISMFFLGIFAVSIITMLLEIRRFKKDNERMNSFMNSVTEQIQSNKLQIDSRITEISKKVDSRVDKALLNFKKQNQLLND